MTLQHHVKYKLLQSCLLVKSLFDFNGVKNYDLPQFPANHVTLKNQHFYSWSQLLKRFNMKTKLKDMSYRIMKKTHNPKMYTFQHLTMLASELERKLEEQCRKLGVQYEEPGW